MLQEAVRNDSTGPIWNEIGCDILKGEKSVYFYFSRINWALMGKIPIIVGNHAHIFAHLLPKNSWNGYGQRIFAKDGQKWGPPKFLMIYYLYIHIIFPIMVYINISKKFGSRGFEPMIT